MSHPQQRTADTKMAEKTTPVENDEDITTTKERICTNNVSTQSNVHTVFESRQAAFKSVPGNDLETQSVSESVSMRSVQQSESYSHIYYLYFILFF